jgi:hypothetical protein
MFNKSDYQSEIRLYLQSRYDINNIFPPVLETTRKDGRWDFLFHAKTIPETANK